VAAPQLDAQRGAADEQRRARRHGDLAHPRTLVPRAVGRAEVADDEPSAVGAHGEVARRHPIVGQHERGAGGGTDLDLASVEPARATAVHTIDDHELTAQPAAATVEHVAVHCCAPHHVS